MKDTDNSTICPLVGIVMGSESDWPVMQAAAKVLKDFAVPYEARVISAHRTPDLAFDYAAGASGRGLRCIIAGAGGAAHLAGILAAKTIIPVLGVPVPSKHLQGLDSLLSIVQMPKGIPVATFAIGEAGAANAALTVARVLSIDEEIAIEALNNFIGAWRRMEYKGKLNGAKIYDDYGHHPTEIKATLAGACELLAISHKPLAKLWCVFQPHQYQRTYNLFDQFVSAFGAADKIILLPIYSVAGREDEGIKNKVNSEMLAEKIRNQEAGSKNQEILYLSDFDKVAEYLRKNLQAGDVCVIMGAGDIYKLTEQLLIKE